MRPFDWLKRGGTEGILLLGSTCNTQVSETIAAHSGGCEAACAELMVGEDSTPSPVPYSSAQGKGKRGHDDDQLLQSLEKRVHESGEVLKVLAQPQPITATVAFANYMRDSLLSMSKRRFRMARSRLTPILSEVLDYDSDEEEPPTVHTVFAPASVRTCMAPATHQPPHQMCRQKAPTACVILGLTDNCACGPKHAAATVPVDDASSPSTWVPANLCLCICCYRLG